MTVKVYYARQLACVGKANYPAVSADHGDVCRPAHQASQHQALCEAGRQIYLARIEIAGSTTKK